MSVGILGFPTWMLQEGMEIAVPNMPWYELQESGLPAETEDRF
jgi:hypothetical protein